MPHFTSLSQNHLLFLPSIFIIDHAWTYRANEARQCLMEIPGLLERMASLMNITNEENTREQFVEKVMQEMWKYNNTYSVGEQLNVLLVS